MNKMRKKSSRKKVLFGVWAAFFIVASCVLFCPEANGGKKQEESPKIEGEQKSKGDETEECPLDLFLDMRDPDLGGISSSFWFMDRAEISSLRKISQDWTLVFCVMDSCPWCEKFSPVVAELASVSGFEVYALSFEEGRCGPFQVHENPEFFDIINPEGAAPLLFLAKKEGNEIRPIARGHTDLKEVIQNIQSVVGKDL